jgi:hypothetical protein
LVSGWGRLRLIKLIMTQNIVLSKDFYIFAFELMVARERGALKSGYIGGSNPTQFAKEVARPPFFLYCE